MKAPTEQEVRALQPVTNQDFSLQNSILALRLRRATGYPYTVFPNFRNVIIANDLMSRIAPPGIFATGSLFPAGGNRAKVHCGVGELAA
jgi:hypothetical protein